MTLDGLFDLLGLDTDIPLGHGGGGVLQELLYQGDVVPAVLVDLRGVILSEAVGTDAGISQIITDLPQVPRSESAFPLKASAFRFSLLFP